MTDAGADQSKRTKGCAIAAGVAGVLGCCMGGSFLVMCGGLLGVGQETQLQTISTDLHAACIGHPRSIEYEAELVRFDATRSEVGWMTFGVLNNRYTDANADGVIRPEELDHLMVLVADIDARGGNVDLASYPSGR
jgi:hypothetical protein